MKYTKHVFICANQKAEGKKCCGEAHGMELVNAFRDELKKRELNIEIRAQKAGCLDVCALGPSLVVYPEGVFYGNVQLQDVNEIIEEHLVNDRIVERLKLPF